MADGSLLARARSSVTRPYRMWRAVSGASTIPVGLSPRREIWSLNRIKLYKYAPTQPPDERHSVPLLLVYAVITRPYLLDMRPGNSFIEFMVDQGFDVYLVDWGAPGPEDAGITLDDYAAEYLPRVVRRVLADAGTDTLNMLGYCFGSLVALLYAALNPNGPLANLVLLTPPVDMSETQGSKFAVWLDPRWFNVDRFVDDTGNLPVSAITTGAKLLKAVANYVGAYVMLWDRLDDPHSVQSWQAMHRWVHEGPDLPAEAFRQWVRDFLWGNALVSGRHMVGDQLVDLSRITIPILAVLAELDHIVPKMQSIKVADYVGSEDVRTEVLQAGHVGIMSGRSASKHLWPMLGDWLAEHSVDG